jgi:predicted nucleic-acid-binding protein
MVAVDANVVVRYLVQDDAGQALRATRLLRSQPVWLAKTVLLECEWVLRGAYQFPPDEIAAAFRALLGLANVEVEDAPAVAAALHAVERGMDFADALHAASAATRRFVTFDTAFIKRAAKAGIQNVEML